jgi:hypothetical protein
MVRRGPLWARERDVMTEDCKARMEMLKQRMDSAVSAVSRVDLETEI